MKNFLQMYNFAFIWYKFLFQKLMELKAVIRVCWKSRPCQIWIIWRRQNIFWITRLFSLSSFNRNAEKLFSAEIIRQRGASPASLTRLSTRIMLAIHDSLVPFNLALIRFNPYAVLPCPNLPSIGFRSPGLTWFDTADGLPSGFAISLMFLSLSMARFARVQKILTANTSAG